MIALMLGILLSAQPTTSVTGKLVWVCTYQVNGRSVPPITLDHRCPQTMNFN